MPELPLRPYQQEGIDKLMRRPDKRLLFAWSVGAGKTLGAIGVAQALGAKRILVIAPALARSVWVREFQKWNAGDAVPIIHGRKRKFACSRERFERNREKAYAADIQVVSYTLLREMDDTRRDLLILDEVHNLRNPLCAHSRLVKAFMRKYPDMPCVALSGTPMPNDLQTIWNPIDCLVPDALGPATRTGNVSWWFKDTYMVKCFNEFAMFFEGAKPGAPEKLAKRIEPYLHRVVEADFAQYVPPLQTSMMYVDVPRKPVDIAKEWVSERIQSGAKKLAVLCFYREMAQNLFDGLDGLSDTRGFDGTLVDGTSTTEERVVEFARLSEVDSCFVVATSESVREAISLSFIKDVLIVEWLAAPVRAIQLLGRFARADSATQEITRVTYLALPGSEAQAESLEGKLKAVAETLRPDAKSNSLREVFKARTLTQERISRMFGDYNEAATEEWDDDWT